MSADDNAPEQAREVEVVARVLRDWVLPGVPPAVMADLVLAALAPIRAAERQEVARVAWDAALSATHDAPDGSFSQAQSRETAIILLSRARDRADGVTGRSET